MPTMFTELNLQRMTKVYNLASETVLTNYKTYALIRVLVFGLEGQNFPVISSSFYGN